MACQLVLGARRDLTQDRLELGEQLLDRVEAGERPAARGSTAGGGNR